MTRLLALTAGLLLFIHTEGQSSCDKEKLSKEDKALLQQFCISFKKAVIAKEQYKLAELISFPFTCSYCIYITEKKI